ncbi:MAG: hypothetical protein KBT49_05220 [Bacteroidetes bacterium]|nr:hypothetical protein [Candidatus Colenecus caballi]
MKKSALILMSMAAMFGLSSCDKELVPAEIVNDKANVIYASTGDNTRTALSYNNSTGKYDVVWSKNDAFRLNGNDFKLTSEPGSTTGKFEGITPTVDGEYTAYYPATYNGTNWPTSQTYTAGNITGSPMTAQVEVVSGVVARTVQFRNAGGILRLTVNIEENEENEENVSISKITVCADELESPITLDCSNNEESGEALTADGVEFNIAMPSNGNEPASYSNVSIYLTDTNGNICRKSLKSGVKLEIARSKITKASFSVSKDKFSSKVTIDGHDGIVVDIDGKKVIVATMNVGAESVNGYDCFGTKMTYDKACAACAACAAWSGWRLPDVDEFTTLCDPFYPGVCGDTEGVKGGKGAMMWNIDGIDGIDLYLPLNNYDEYDNPSDIYWTGTSGSNGTYYYFAPAIDWENGYAPLDPDYIRKEPVDITVTTNTYLVRLFHDLP